MDVSDSIPFISPRYLEIRAHEPKVMAIHSSCCLFSHPVCTCFSSWQAELGDRKKQSYVEADTPGVLGIIQTWNTFSLCHYLNGLVTDLPGSASPSTK